LNNAAAVSLGPYSINSPLQTTAMVARDEGTMWNWILKNNGRC